MVWVRTLLQTCHSPALWFLVSTPYTFVMHKETSAPSGNPSSHKISANSTQTELDIGIEPRSLVLGGSSSINGKCAAQSSDLFYLRSQTQFTINLQASKDPFKKSNRDLISREWSSLCNRYIYVVKCERASDFRSTTCSLMLELVHLVSIMLQSQIPMKTECKWGSIAHKMLVLHD